MRSSQPVVRSATYTQHRASADGSQLTVIALQAGAAVLATRYWIEGSDLHCVTQDGAEQTFSLALVDLPQTVKVNQERNVDFSLHTVHPRAATLPNPVEQ